MYLLPIVEQQEVLYSGRGKVPYHKLPEKAKRLVSLSPFGFTFSFSLNLNLS